MNTENSIVLLRCRDRHVIGEFLERDYFDFPICAFSKSLRRDTASWMASSDSVYFIVATTDGHNAAFVFANTLGKRLWRTFAREYPWHLPALLIAYIQSRFARKWSGQLSRFSHALPAAQAEKADSLAVPNTDLAFRWSDPDSRMGYVELLFVSEACRGRNVGPQMLQLLAREMGSQGIERIEAHIDSANYASARAFIKAGWMVIRTPQSDFIAYITCSDSARP